MHAAHAQPGLCYDGIPDLLTKYPTAKIAYNPDLNHVWLITETDQFIDPYYGPCKANWTPTYLFSNVVELDKEIWNQTGVKL